MVEVPVTTALDKTDIKDVIGTLRLTEHAARTLASQLMNGHQFELQAVISNSASPALFSVAFVPIALERAK